MGISHWLRLHWEELGTLHSAPSNKTMWGGPSGCSCEWRAHRIVWVVRKQGQKTSQQQTLFLPGTRAGS